MINELAQLLDERIAQLLKAPDGVPSETFAAILVEVATGIAVADRIANVNRERAYDPATIDPVARGKCDDATFVAARLRNGQAMLTTLHQTAVKREEREKYKAEAAVIERKIVDFAKEMATVYPVVVLQLTDLFRRIAVADREASNFNNRAAHGHFVRGVEATIGDGSARIIERVRLPALTDKGVVDMWPPQNNWASAYVESVHAGIVGAGMPASVEDRIAASERQIDFVKAQEAGRMKKNEEAEMRAREHGTERRRLQAGG